MDRDVGDTKFTGSASFIYFLPTQIIKMIPMPQTRQRFKKLDVRRSLSMPRIPSSINKNRTKGHPFKMQTLKIAMDNDLKQLSTGRSK